MLGYNKIKSYFSQKRGEFNMTYIKRDIEPIIREVSASYAAVKGKPKYFGQFIPETK
jgi:hypothetical protein